ncbi:MAG: ParB N-terminal domain-containing protein [Planctomycetota bacterium]
MGPSPRTLHAAATWPQCFHRRGWHAVQPARVARFFATLRAGRLHDFKRLVDCRKAKLESIGSAKSSPEAECGRPSHSKAWSFPPCLADQARRRAPNGHLRAQCGAQRNGFRVRESVRIKTKGVAADPRREAWAHARGTPALCNEITSPFDVRPSGDRAAAPQADSWRAPALTSRPRTPRGSSPRTPCPPPSGPSTPGRPLRAPARARNRTRLAARDPLSALHQDPANARSHPERNLASIRASLARFGQAEPLVVLKGAGRVIGGNGRLVAMQSLGWTECDIVELELSPVEAAALGIALNRTAELAEWDDDTLAQLLQSLRADGLIDGLGFDAKEIEELIHDAGLELPSPTEDPGEQAPPEQPVTQRGDLWILGNHRLLCGDSTSTEDVARLMAGETAVPLATDPPYLAERRPSSVSWRLLVPDRRTRRRPERTPRKPKRFEGEGRRARGARQVPSLGGSAQWPKSLSFPRGEWYARRDSNSRPSAPEGLGPRRWASGFERYPAERSGFLSGKKRKRADSKGKERNLAGATTSAKWALPGTSRFACPISTRPRAPPACVRTRRAAQ